MATVLMAMGSLVFYLIAYHTYGRWLARKIFALDPEAKTPSVAQQDGVDYVPSRKEVVFGHHFTSIAGTGPIVGPAIAIIWGWLPALIWVLVGSVVMGAVHDFGALVLSLRNRGISIADLAGSVICRRARVLLMAVVFFELLIVVAIFAMVIASVFAIYPQSVIPVWLEIPIALALGVIITRARGSRAVWLASIGAVAVMYATVVVGAYLPLEMPSLLGFPPTFVWAIVLLVYAFVASVLPVQRLLQPRNFINSHQLFIAMGLLLLGVLVARPAIVAPAIHGNIAQTGAPPFFPFLFITIACGAISGFHSLVSSGTSAKQLSTETDAQLVGYGSMLVEGFLAVLVIIAVSAGIGLHYERNFVLPAGLDAGSGVYRVAERLARPAAEGAVELPEPEAAPEEALAVLKSMQGFRERNPEVLMQPRATGEPQKTLRHFTASLEGKTAWNEHYRSWGAAKGLGPKLKAFVDGAANMMAAFGMPAVVGLAIMAVFVASFAGTTLDTATRLQRYIIGEFGRAVRVPLLENRYVATAIAVGTAGGLALWDGKGTGALILWPLFGALNQLLASLALLVVAVYLHRKQKPTWMVAAPFAFMLVMTAWAMAINIRSFRAAFQWHLFIIAAIVLALQAWITLEAAFVWLRIRKERRHGPPQGAEAGGESG